MCFSKLIVAFDFFEVPRDFGVGDITCAVEICERSESFLSESVLDKLTSIIARTG